MDITPWKEVRSWILPLFSKKSKKKHKHESSPPNVMAQLFSRFSECPSFTDSLHLETQSILQGFVTLERERGVACILTECHLEKWEGSESQLASFTYLLSLILQDKPYSTGLQIIDYFHDLSEYFISEVGDTKPVSKVEGVESSISNLCVLCQEEVKHFSGIIVENNTWHKCCFKCNTCGMQLRQGTYRIVKDAGFSCINHMYSNQLDSIINMKNSGEDTNQQIALENPPAKEIQPLNEAMKPNKNLGEDIKPKENLMEATKPNENLDEAMKQNENLNEAMKSNENLGEVMKPNENLNEAMKSNENLGEDIKPNENLNEAMKTNENLGEDIKPNEPEGDTTKKLVNEPIEEQKDSNSNKLYPDLEAKVDELNIEPNISISEPVESNYIPPSGEADDKTIEPIIGAKTPQSEMGEDTPKLVTDDVTKPEVVQENIVEQVIVAKTITPPVAPPRKRRDHSRNSSISSSSRQSLPPMLYSPRDKPTPAPRMSKIVLPLEYPTDMNPFDDESSDSDYDHTLNPFADDSGRSSCTQSLNPFGDDLEVDQHKHIAKSPPPVPPKPTCLKPPAVSPRPSARKSKAPAPPCKKKKHAPPPPLPLKRKIAMNVGEDGVTLSDVITQFGEVDAAWETVTQAAHVIRPTIIGEITQKCVNDVVLSEWYKIVCKRCALIEKEVQLVHAWRELVLNEFHSEVEFQLRCIIEKPEKEKTDLDEVKEAFLLKLLLGVIEQKNELVDTQTYDSSRAVSDSKHHKKLKLRLKNIRKTMKRSKGHKKNES